MGRVGAILHNRQGADESLPCFRPYVARMEQHGGSLSVPGSGIDGAPPSPLPPARRGHHRRNFSDTTALARRYLADATGSAEVRSRVLPEYIRGAANAGTITAYAYRALPMQDRKASDVTVAAVVTFPLQRASVCSPKPSHLAGFLCLAVECISLAVRGILACIVPYTSLQ